MSETVLCTARAVVLLYDDTHKQWVAAGGGPQTLSCVQLYHHPGANAFRLVGRKMQPDQQVVLNCLLGRGLRYSQATPQFHQWREARRVWGLSFGAPREAALFATAVQRALRALEEGTLLSWPDPDGLALEEPEQQERQVLEEPERPVVAAGTQAVPTGGPPAAPWPPTASGAPPHPLAFCQPPGSRRPPLCRWRWVLLGGGPGGAPVLPLPSQGLNSGKSARMKRWARGAPLHPPRARVPGGGAGGGLMEEMSAMLARRRKATLQGDKPAPKKDEDVTSDEAEPGTRTSGQPAEPVRRPWEKASSMLPRMKSAVPAAPADTPGPADEPNLERIKQELLEEVRRELQKMKEEIIEAFVVELRKRSAP
ncbi:vasodilator-stimulated phosphoprotein-like isoform X2 [Aquila chrysaetos chrysaetos]|uniref:vasodilator-stimulated phosphoprotein-like isoform X2 n=1 Tax=Aquila chrysaetos chrysaetos TaxID=223781 RepID=UPI0011770786|nr:vasodilator-stimulated phosphoprotein-like isoform X2 [Aquila chrysaetos chrysaetos]